MPSQKYRDINFLIQHLKHEDIHLYEALNVTNDNVNNLVKVVDDVLVPSVPPVIQERYIFGLGQGGDITVGVEPTSYVTCEQPNGARLFRWRIRANIAPTGSDIQVDIKKGGSSILPVGAGNKIVLPAGQLKAKKENAFITNPFTILFDEELVPEVLQVGSGTPGFRVIIQLTGVVL